MTATSSLYFISCGATGPIKIGRARDVEKRRATLQTGSPIPLVIVAVIDGGAGYESLLHRQFPTYSLGFEGEWFEREPVTEFLDLLADIHEERTGEDTPRLWRDLEVVA